MFPCGLLNSLLLFNKSWNMSSVTVRLIGNILICSNYPKLPLRPERARSKQVHHRWNNSVSFAKLRNVLPRREVGDKISNRREEEKNKLQQLPLKMWLWGEIKEQQNKMTVSLTALIIVCHMVANNKYGERQWQHYPSISQSGSLSSSPMRARLHLIKSFNLDHLSSAALFTTLHLGNATTCSSSSSRAER